MQESVHIAIDLGAGSGRVMSARVAADGFELFEEHRFENPATELPDGLVWNLVGLYREILEGLRRTFARHGKRVASIGIDTWGCDFVWVDRRGALLGMPHCYRDPRFAGMAEVLHARMPEAELFRRTGVKTNFYNSSLHLLAERERGAGARCQGARLLFVPDLLAFWLSGRAVVERTIASTSQLLDPRTGDWEREVIGALGLPQDGFGEIVAPGTVLGPLRPEVARELGGGPVPVVATASHDTAAAVAGIPLDAAEPLWLSSGTWSILGVELGAPVTTPEALAAGFCNELGVAGSVRFLKNIAGLWLIQECRRQWAAEGRDMCYEELARRTEEAPAWTAFVDPDAPEFASPGGMPEKIRAWCAASGQRVPQSEGEVLRVATESLALKYRLVYERLCKLTGRRYSRLHAGGGGIRNAFLNQATADALGIEVLAGPVEATSCGNVLTQLVATGRVADFAVGRDLIRETSRIQRYLPREPEAWNRAFDRFRALMGE